MTPHSSLQNSLLSRLKKPWSLTLSLLGKCFRSYHPSGPLLNFLWFIHVLVLGGPQLDAVFRWSEEC